MRRLLEVWVEVENRKDAEEIAHDLREILGDCGFNNHIIVTDEVDE